MSEPDCDIFVRLDEDDCIVACGGRGWSDDSEPGAGAALSDAELIGKPIYRFVAGHFTKRFLRVFLSEARAAAAPLSRLYRCDTPKLRRLMEMRARREAGRALIVEHRLVGVQNSPVTVACRQPPGIRRAPYLRCSMCNRLKQTATTLWREPDEAFPAGGAPRVVHTVCPECRSGIAARLPLDLVYCQSPRPR